MWSTFHPCDLFVLLISSVTQRFSPDPHKFLEQRQVLDPCQSTPNFRPILNFGHSLTLPKF